MTRDIAPLLEESTGLNKVRSVQGYFSHYARDPVPIWLLLRKTEQENAKNKHAKWCA